MYLRYQEQDCGLTLREGIAEYHAYLEAIGRKAMVDHAGSRPIRSAISLFHYIRGYCVTPRGKRANTIPPPNVSGR